MTVSEEKWEELRAGPIVVRAGTLFPGASPLGRKFTANFEPEVSESLMLCARHHLKKVVGPPMSHLMGRWRTVHFFSLPSQTPLEGVLCIWLLGPAPCVVNTAPEAGRPGSPQEGLD